MSIWFGNPDLAQVHNMVNIGLNRHLGITLTEIGDDFVRGTMPVRENVLQPFGILHGGASVSLAESLGSIAGYLVTDPKKQNVVGLDINANHVRAVRNGVVTGTARPVHLGRSTQVWNIHIADDSDRLVCISRLTLSVLNRPS